MVEVKKTDDQTVSYEIGQTGFDTSSYGFEQSPGCGFSETTVIDAPSNLPSFITHDAGNKRFTIADSTDFTKDGTYVVLVRHTVTYSNNPLDLTQTTTEVVEV